jgi:UDP-N-acetylglucosamine pyrophosphorylase
LKKLLDAGIKYAFVSNVDNLGALLDGKLLHYFAESNLSFLMEVTPKTEMDVKGGHVARRKSDGRLVLRELAQCPEEDKAHFQDIERYRYFNTNNLWVRLDHLDELLKKEGSITLPLIRNTKTVDPRDKKSPQVVQLENAMGAAIECFEKTGVIEVPRSRFSPVKTTAELFVLRSDAYEIDKEFGVHLISECKGHVPEIIWDEDCYKFVDQVDEKTAKGVPSLKHCKKLILKGSIFFEPHTIIEGEVEVINDSYKPKTLPAGKYSNQTVKLK